MDERETKLPPLRQSSFLWGGAGVALLVLVLQCLGIDNGYAPFIPYSFAACWMLSILATLLEIRDRQPPSTR